MKYDKFVRFDIYSDPTAPSTVFSHASLPLYFQLTISNNYLYILTYSNASKYAMLNQLDRQTVSFSENPRPSDMYLFSYTKGFIKTQ